MTHHASTDLVRITYVTQFAKDYGSHLCFGLKSDLFLIHFQTKVLQVFLISMHAIYHVHLILFDLVTASRLLNLILATAADFN
jgi:hypothetical protein